MMVKICFYRFLAARNHVDNPFLRCDSVFKDFLHFGVIKSIKSICQRFVRTNLTTDLKSTIISTLGQVVKHRKISAHLIENTT